MLKAKNLFALVIVTALAVVAAAYSLQEPDALPKAGTTLYPDLLNRVNDVNEVVVAAEGERFTLQRRDGRWVSPDRGGYPLDGDKVHQLLVGTSALTRIEPKTSNPELYARLGVEDPESTDSASVRFSLKDAAGGVLADLIVGEGKPAKGDPTASEYFVREAGEAQSWLVQGRVPRDADTPTDWLAGEIASISGDRIYQVRTTHPDGEVVTVRKDAPGDGGFNLVESPPGVEIKDRWRLNDMGRVLADLALEDVRPAGEAGDAFSGNVLKVVATSFDGLVVNMEVADLGEDEHLARLSATYDPEQASAGAALESDVLMGANDVEQEVARLNQRWTPWVYGIPRYKADYVSKSVADFLPEPEPEEGAGQTPVPEVAPATQ